MIHGTWGIGRRYRFRRSKNPNGDGDAICYVRGQGERLWVVIHPDGEDVPSLVPAGKLEFKVPGHRWSKEP